MGDIHKQKGYAIVATGTGAASIDSRGIALLASGASIPNSTAYGLLANPASIMAAPTYAVLANPAVITASPTYGLFANPASIIAAPGYALLAPFYPPYEDVRVVVSFVEQQFPNCVSFGSTGGPGFKTSVFEFDSGYTADVIEWERMRAKYTVTFENATPADIEQVLEFFYGMRGQAVGFRYKDWSDYQIVNQNVLVGDGSTVRFEIFKRYTSGGNNFDRIIRKPVRNTPDLQLDGVPLIENLDYFINYTTGEIVFPTAPAAGSICTIIYMEFDVPVRFDTDQLDIAYDDFRQLGINNLSLVELRI